MKYDILKDQAIEIIGIKTVISITVSDDEIIIKLKND